MNEPALLSARRPHSCSSLKIWLKSPLLHPAKHPASLRSVPLYKNLKIHMDLWIKRVVRRLPSCFGRKEVWPMQMANGNEVAGRNRPVLYQRPIMRPMPWPFPAFAVEKAPQSTCRSLLLDVCHSKSQRFLKTLTIAVSFKVSFKLVVSIQLRSDSHGDIFLSQRQS